MQKVLIISYYWPPSGGSGVQRWLKFAKYLPLYDWKPIIYTPENPYLEIQDKELNNDVVDIEVWRRKIWEPYMIKDRLFGTSNIAQTSGVILNKKSIINRCLNWIRGNLFIPDPKIFWVAPSVKFLNKKIKKEKIKYIITTGPPHSMHLIGLRLKKDNNVKWIADFRDPWSSLDILDNFYLSNLTKKKHINLELEVIKEADITLTVSENWRTNLNNLGAKRTEIITNGYDNDDFKIRNKHSSKFIIGHYGLINHLRNPVKLWKTLNEICQRDSSFKEKLEIHLAGNIDPDIITEIKSYNHLFSKVKLLGYLTHSEVIDAYHESSLLLLLLFNSSSGVGNYPGKLFEYFAAKKPIIAFGPKGSDTERMLSGIKHCIYHDYDNDNIEDDILAVFNNHPNFNNIKVNSDYSRKNLTKNLVKLLNSIK